MKSHPELPCEVCGSPRTFLVQVQWCSQCGWNLQSAIAELRTRFRVMLALAVCIAVGLVLLFKAAPETGISYLPLGAFLIAAITLIPYRDYREVQHTLATVSNLPKPEVVSSKLHSLQPELRTSALFLLCLAIAADLVLLFLPGSLISRLLPVGGLFLVIVLFGGKFLEERSIVASYSATLAKITGFAKSSPRRGRTSVYEYRDPAGNLITGQGGSLHGFSVGMSVPVLLSTSEHHKSLPVPDFLFYRILDRSR